MTGFFRVTSINHVWTHLHAFVGIEKGLPVKWIKVHLAIFTARLNLFVFIGDSVYDTTDT